MFGILGSVSLGLIYVLRYVIVGRTLPGWLTLVLLLILFSGFNFMAFGIVGEYLLRILQCAHDTPQYLVRHTLVSSEESPGATTELS
jgi:dolichol-phosphate mannosyltransferase/undecaprenyl-phosphate 4-deoxy-4-formamido-L-arabinose transferase